MVLGRQHFLSPNPDARTKRQMTVYQRMLEQFVHDLKIEKLIDSDGFCNSLFDFLELEKLDYMDVSKYEGANVIHDLNTHVPAYEATNNRRRDQIIGLSCKKTI